MPIKRKQGRNEDGERRFDYPHKHRDNLAFDEDVALPAFTLLRIHGSRAIIATRFASLSEVLDWATARWPETEWQEKPEAIALDLIEAFSGYAWRVEIEEQ